MRERKIGLNGGVSSPPGYQRGCRRAIQGLHSAEVLIPVGQVGNFSFALGMGSRDVSIVNLPLLDQKAISSVDEVSIGLCLNRFGYSLRKPLRVRPSETDLSPVWPKF